LGSNQRRLSRRFYRPPIPTHRNTHRPAHSPFLTASNPRSVRPASVHTKSPRSARRGFRVPVQGSPAESRRVPLGRRFSIPSAVRCRPSSALDPAPATGPLTSSTIAASIRSWRPTGALLAAGPPDLGGGNGRSGFVGRERKEYHLLLAHCQQPRPRPGTQRRHCIIGGDGVVTLDVLGAEGHRTGERTRLSPNRYSKPLRENPALDHIRRHGVLAPGVDESSWDEPSDW
jgi:hypothetical protein